MSKTVTIYTTPTCHFCHMTKDFFAEHNIEFTEYNAAADLDRRKEMVEKSGQMGVPVVVVKDETGKEDIIVGFDKPKLESLLLAHA